MENNIREKIVLAALLHDIGKFWQRGDEHFKISKIVQEEFKGHYDSIVPTYPEGHPKYVHALWTYAFFSHFKTHHNLNLKGSSDSVQNLSAKHHRPSNINEGFISLADKWSSGIDRPDEGEEDVSGYNEIKSKWGNDFVRKIPMYSIFNSLKVGANGEKSTNQQYFPLEKLDVLSTDTPIFPKELGDQIIKGDRKENYAILWSEFVKKYELLPTTNFKVFYHSLLNLLKEFTWSIPSATNMIPANVSLFEHLKSTAGLAICLYDHYAENENLWDKNENWNPTLKPDTDPVLMLCVDMSGIQKFIYDISSSKAAKSLKGRSFYLQLLVQSITNQILFDEDINLFYSNIIYASGGKSYILLPNTEKIKKALVRIEKEIEAQLWQKYKGKIYAAFGTASFRYNSFKAQNTGNWSSQIKTVDPELDKVEFDLGKLWKAVSDRAGEKKRSKFKNTILSNFNEFFPEAGIAYEEGTDRCSVSGDRFMKSKMENISKDDEGETLVSPYVAEQISVGNKLKSAESIATFYKVSNGINGINPGGLETKVELYNKKTSLPSVTGINSRFFINEFPKSFNEFPNYAHQTIFYGGNIMPEKANGEAKSFHDLVEFVDRNGNVKLTKLGFLRMDIDGLGQIFIKGLEEDNKSFAAYATLSMMLDLFFSGYLNKIRNDESFKDWIQILYSGGDDLFIIGRWDKVISFGEVVREEFRKFVGRNDISISGGVAIVGAKYPITKAAELAADAEKASKRFKNEEKGKDAFTFFDQTISWGKEYNAVKSLRDQFIYFDGQYGRGALQQLQTYYLIKKESEKEAVKDLSYKWHSAYYLSGLIERIKRDNDPAKIFFSEIRDNILNNSTFGANRYLDLVALAARWSEYLLKMNL